MPRIGVGPYGFGTAIPPVPPNPVTIGSSRLIGTDAANRGQYVDNNGNPTFGGDVRQLVTLACTTILGSSAVAELGRGAEPPDFADNFEQEKRAQIDAAVSHLVADGLIRVLSVQVVEQDGGRSFTRVVFFDLTTSTPFSVRI